MHLQIVVLNFFVNCYYDVIPDDEYEVGMQYKVSLLDTQVNLIDSMVSLGADHENHFVGILMKLLKYCRGHHHLHHWFYVDY